MISDVPRIRAEVPGITIPPVDDVETGAFTEHLENNLIIEWKVKYLNYRRLNSILTAIKSQQDGSSTVHLPASQSTSVEESKLISHGVETCSSGSHDRPRSKFLSEILKARGVPEPNELEMTFFSELETELMKVQLI